MANVFEPEFEAELDRPPFRWRRAFIGKQAGAEKLGASLFEVAPGAACFPLHVHHSNEEMVIVLAGRPTLRTLSGERELAPGEVVACPVGEGGAHRVDNRTEEAVRILVVSTMLAPEIVEHPDSDKVYIRNYVPGTERPKGALDLILRRAESLDLLDGETD